jgi:hypothetical protein
MAVGTKRHVSLLVSRASGHTNNSTAKYEAHLHAYSFNAHARTLFKDLSKMRSRQSEQIELKHAGRVCVQCQRSVCAVDRVR